jgi:hypothetical protein
VIPNWIVQQSFWFSDIKGMSLGIFDIMHLPLLHFCIMDFLEKNQRVEWLLSVGEKQVVISGGEVFQPRPS